MVAQAPERSLSDDLLIGANAIADYTGERPRRVYHLTERKEQTGFPFFKRGATIYSRKSWLDRYYAGQPVEVPA